MTRETEETGIPHKRFYGIRIAVLAYCIVGTHLIPGFLVSRYPTVVTPNFGTGLKILFLIGATLMILSIIFQDPKEVYRHHV